MISRAYWSERILGAVLPALLALMLAAAAADACENPVYEYALLNWLRQPYVVLQYCGPDEDMPTQLERTLAEVTLQGRPNLTFHRIDVGRLDEFPDESLVARAWEGHRQLPLPFCVVVAPNGQELLAGPMTPEGARALVQSPQRAVLAGLLAGGKEGLLLLLGGSDGTATDRAAETVESALERAMDAGHDVGWMTVERDDPGEQWLVRQLLSVRQDLLSVDQPMLFAVFGRGRVVQPHIGRRITVEAVQGLIAFLKGPCTCSLLDDVPNVDLLTNFDWETAASGPAEQAERPYYSLLAAPEEHAAPAEAKVAPSTSPAVQPGGLRLGSAAALGSLAVAVVAAGLLIMRKRQEV